MIVVFLIFLFMEGFCKGIVVKNVKGCLFWCEESYLEIFIDFVDEFVEDDVVFYLKFFYSVKFFIEVYFFELLVFLCNIFFML